MDTSCYGKQLDEETGELVWDAKCPKEGEKEEELFFGERNLGVEAHREGSA
eukprot:CAMPEP_0203751612 /NCGR_PEP_ID=MMETSP0098-20131031/5658_1 /ASSEMBLY_ACC=CAM_ASM_000208 /TAXON_ID=96639 /ORGANISM=" , Strain NY0313808BC1" /LENGTH=50 /DNA_ID=CAMNT_0050641415 /DNA_START=357 /DNA_END=509 /DNA_ORIENTATION=-